MKYFPIEAKDTCSLSEQVFMQDMTNRKQSPTGEMPDPLIELALRVQPSGVPPAYGSWLLTPRPPLHEGEKQPCCQKRGRGVKLLLTAKYLGVMRMRGQPRFATWGFAPAPNSPKTVTLRSTPCKGCGNAPRGLKTAHRALFGVPEGGRAPKAAPQASRAAVLQPCRAWLRSFNFDQKDNVIQVLSDIITLP